jgi:hypothetical protein
MLSEKELREEIENFTKRHTDSVKSSEYTQFRDELIPSHFSFYEKACNLSEKILSIKADPVKFQPLQEALETCHINATPNGVTAFALLFPLAFMLSGIAASFLLTNLLMGGKSLFFFVFVFIIAGVGIMLPLTTLPMLLANNWRLKASNQMVMSIFYIVSYMRHTSNLELAIKFTSDHISPPLSLDFKKLMWNVETGKYESMKISLDNYLSGWKKYNPEFVESMHLIESSLFETTDKKRLDALEKSLNLILEATYEKMLHFAQNLKSPIEALHMLGVILPVLGLVILPLMIAFMEGVEWYHISVFYNIFLPAIVWYFGKSILSTRPTGYGQADITEINPELKKFENVNVKMFGNEYWVNPKWFSFAIFAAFFLIGMIPIIIHTSNLIQKTNFDIIVNVKNQVIQTGDQQVIDGAKFALLGYKVGKTKTVIGPFGLGSTLLSLSIPFGLAMALGYYFYARTKKLIEIRDKTKVLEQEFASALFQLGNRVGDGLPAEIAFMKVAEITENTESGKFFDLVSINIATLGMGIEEAIFHKQYGAINKFPSALIESSMKVFVESAKKGPDVASESLLNISNYIKEMHRVDERLKDLMSESSSSMKGQINFLAPLISGIVIGLTSMITTILNTLGSQMGNFTSDAGVNGAQGDGLLAMFGNGIPTFYFQIVVGIYVVQITFLLTQMLNTLENGYDPLNEKYMLGVNLVKSGRLYTMISFGVILMFNLIAASVIAGLGSAVK